MFGDERIRVRTRRLAAVRRWRFVAVGNDYVYESTHQTDGAFASCALSFARASHDGDKPRASVGA